MLWLGVLLMLGLLLSTAPALASDDVSLSGYVRGYAGLLLDDDNPYSIVQNTLETSVEYRGEMGALKATPFVYVYPTAQGGELFDFGLRQAYAEVNFDDFDLRVGKQQIVWGKGDGVFITDIVSPKDLTEFLLRDFEEIRQGVTAVKGDYYFGDYTLELVLIPVFTPTRLPPPGSRWRPALDFPVQPSIDRSKEAVDLTLENGEFFVKLSSMSAFLDYEIMGGYMWDDDPAMHVTRVIDPATQQLSGIQVRPEHHRLAVGGGSFSTTLAGFVLRGEGAYYHGKMLRTADPDATDALVEKDYLHYLLGVDKNLAGLRLSGQVIQQVIVQYDDAILDDEVTTTFTVLASANFLRETLRLELFSYIGLNTEDALLRARAIYDVTDGLEVLLGADIFIGEQGPFGQYDNNDMVYSKVKYSF